MATTAVRFIVDADSHWTEPPDLFTKRAPAAIRDRVPRVEKVDDQPSWVFDGNVIGRASAAAVIGRDGLKEQAQKALFEWTVDDVHVGAYDPKVRLEVLDELGIDALKRATIEIYNDAMAEIQEESGNRLLGMPLMPGWDVDACVAEAKRVAGLGARGVNMTSDPQDDARQLYKL